MLVLCVDSGCTRFVVMGETLQTDLVSYSLYSPSPSSQPPDVASPLCLAHPFGAWASPWELGNSLVGFPLGGTTDLLEVYPPSPQEAETHLTEAAEHRAGAVSTFTTSLSSSVACSSFLSSQHRGRDTQRMTMSWWSEHFTLQDATCCISAIKTLFKLEISFKALWLSELWVAELYNTYVVWCISKGGSKGILGISPFLLRRKFVSEAVSLMRLS